MTPIGKIIENWYLNIKRNKYGERIIDINNLIELEKEITALTGRKE